MILLQVIVGLVALSSVQGNPSEPDVKMSCSFDLNVNQVSSQINLCSLNGNVNLTVVNTTSIVSQSKGTGGASPSRIHIYRYYCLNPFNRIVSSAQRCPTPVDPATTNCPRYSMSCLVSYVSFQCNSDQENGICIKPQSTADSYGYQRKWNISLHDPQSLSSDEDVKGANAVITIQAGPCYFCKTTKLPKLSTVIGFYCDERVKDKGSPWNIHIPNKPQQATFHWTTSKACYEFKPEEKCQLNSGVCSKDKTFTCTSTPNKYKFSFPSSANRSISHYRYSTNRYTTYVFGFCAQDVQCPTTNKSVMICKKEFAQSGKITSATALAYYTDKIEIIIRPTGFVWRIEQRHSRSLKAVISFECSPSSSSSERILDFSVSENHSLPILLTLKHKCFCPNKQPCQEIHPAPNPLTTSRPRRVGHSFLIAGSLIAVCVVFGIGYLVYQCRKNNHDHDGSQVPNFPPNDNNHHDHEERQHINETPPPSSYHSFSSTGTSSSSRSSYQSFSNNSSYPSSTSSSSRTSDPSISSISMTSRLSYRTCSPDGTQLDDIEEKGESVL